MRLREAHVPVVLWLCAAALIHFGGAEQGERIANMQEGKSKLRMVARDLAAPPAPPLEVEISTETLLPETTTPDETAPDPVVPPSSDPTKPIDPKLAEKTKVDAPKPVTPKALPPLPDKTVPPDTKITILEPLPPPLPKPAPPPPAIEPKKPDDKKIAVQQPNEKDDEPANKDAKYWADKNHHVKPGDETHATITSTTDNDKDPNPGTHHGPGKDPGNGDKNVIAQDADRPGAHVAPNVIPKSAAPKAPGKDEAPHPGKKDGDGGKDLASKPKGGTPQPAPAPGKGLTKPIPASPDIVAGPGGTFPVSPASSSSGAVASKGTPGSGDGKPKTLPAIPTLPTPGQGKWVPGLGSGFLGDGGKKVAVSEKVMKAAIGIDELDRLKNLEGQTKLSVHRGAWKSSSLEKWRAAIENYTPGVKPGNQTNLGTAAQPWATYLSQIHVRLHPIFADGFVEGLTDLPSSHPLNDKTLVTRMEIVMKPDGSLHHLGIVKASGQTAFDVAALDAVDRAAPFGKAPKDIVSPDGLVYLHWEFHRDDMRCSNYNAYPYLLKEGSTPKPKEPIDPPKPKPPPEAEKKLGAAPLKSEDG